MIKKLGILSLAIPLIFTFSIACADVSSDMEAEVPLEQVIQNALASGLTIEETVEQMLSVSPDSAVAIISAATLARPNSSTSIAQVAISAGIDPAVVTSATAAPGNVPPGPPSIGPIPGSANAIALARRPIAPPVGGGGGVSPN